MNSNLTLLLPTKDRPEFLSRWMGWAIQEGCPFPIVIADGSADSSFAERQAQRGVRHGLDIEFQRFPFDESWKDFSTKMVTSIASIESPYVSLVCDDDFYDFANMLLAADFLDQNPDFSCAIGQVIDFRLIGPHHNYKSSNSRGVLVADRNSLSCGGRYVSAEGLDNESLGERFQRTNNIWPYESVMRTELAFETFHVALSSEIFTYRQLLPIMQILSVLMGRVGLVDFALVFRQDDTFGSEGSTMIALHRSWADYWSDPKALLVELQIKEQIVKSGQKLLGQDDRQAEILEDYIAASLAKRGSLDPLRPQTQPSILKQTAKKLINKLLLISRNQPANMFIAGLLVTAVVRSYFSDGFIRRLQGFMRTYASEIQAPTQMKNPQ